ncbi:hypothetical protein CYMTET_56600 [Cymbomonas tetramitiformis]|uniref:Uncharacterized protein n=1 Tax=Cymbomonas tetramitiformis TaxID=36881 RepID=A0AAE0ELT5_9CHLO|nr:hypothetical protein CYMTET_56600 [Cymbomonas tetramitiformis]
MSLLVGKFCSRNRVTNLEKFTRCCQDTTVQVVWNQVTRLRSGSGRNTAGIRNGTISFVRGHQHETRFNVLIVRCG